MEASQAYLGLPRLYQGAPCQCPRQVGSVQGQCEWQITLTLQPPILQYRGKIMVVLENVHRNRRYLEKERTEQEGPQ